MIIGIDLGTSNSLAAYFTEEGPRIIPNRLGKPLTPSVVSMDEQGQIYVGETAQERLWLNQTSAAAVFKRDMGSKREYTLLDKKFTAEELSSFVLRAMKEDAESYLGKPVTEAVISVPAYFNEQRRRATKRAGELAGLKVERIISEPTAAAIAYGLYQNQNQNAKFLVFDLGGGTFDVSILELYGSIIEVRAVAGDNFLGGEDFTRVLEEIFLAKTPALNPAQLTGKQLAHIYKQAELCKHGFSEDRKVKFRCVINEAVYEAVITIEEYETACENLLEKIKEPIKRSLADANIRIPDIHKVIMVGGATRLPVIRSFVSKLFKTLPYFNINPDEAVALGAAVQGAMKERNALVREVILTDVCPFTLGTEVVRDNGDNQFIDGLFCPIIERNTIIPASRTERLYTVRDNQTKVRVNILQGESRFAKNNLSLGELSIEVPKAKAGEEAIDVTYTYDVNSLLEVEVKSVSTGETIRQIIINNETDMTEAEINVRLQELSYMKIHPREREENKLLLLQGERYYEESIGNNRIFIERALRKFEAALDKQDPEFIKAARKEFQEFLSEMKLEL
ncbi:molecular chaperone HscC [Acetonema longum]|uniref:Chaperone protein DnaK n=1 Tax=Acetonema longum DSM 6540 TaxID=1009370 RepID=F7NEV7_9FIRM|nr:molecular chaperone HscC [Acetonema longum]EGO65518.1 Heat shock protein 70 [Acetonema longum DSM 6540]